MSNPTTAVQATRVGDVMTRRLATIGPHTDLVFAYSLMMWSSVRHLPVLDDGKLVGILSDRDLLEKLADAGSNPDPTAITSDVMSTPVETAHPDDDLGEAAARMALKRIDCLPVVLDGKTVGILTTTDVLAERGQLFFKGGKVDVPSVATVMQKRVEVARPDDDLLDAASAMFSDDVRHLPVVDGDGRVIGMLSDRDLRSAVGDPISALRGEPNERAGPTVADAMVPNPVTTTAETSIADLASCFLDERVGAVPVVDSEDRLIGITSYVDLLRHVIATRR
jgi:CBS domain-containing protein